jgi:hypothetical protein
MVLNSYMIHIHIDIILSQINEFPEKTVLQL